MNNNIDQRIVEMQFDNKQFEAGVQTSIKSLDSLKKSLDLDKSAKSLDDLQKAGKNFSLEGIAKNVEFVASKFTALGILGVTAMQRISNAAITTGKNLIKSLSLDQVSAGFSKYEQKTASVQTLINSTGKSLDEINGYLNKLMWFSDETSYSFTDMTQALAQMTSSGGDISKLVPLITGVANATAYAGKGAREFSSVMYNLNQSYGAGYLQRIDWKSVELMGVGSKALKETIIATGVEMGKIKKGQVTISNFADTLQKKWVTTQVMEKAFGKFSELSEAAYELVQAGEYDTASQAMEALAGQYSEVAEKGFKAAQQAKSFSEAIEATKDAVSSGWMKTFEILFGNFEEATVLWTDLTNALWEVFAAGSENRNDLLSKWKELGGREDLIQGLSDTFTGLWNIVIAVRDAIQEVFPPATVDTLLQISSAVKNFGENLKSMTSYMEVIKTYRGDEITVDVVPTITWDKKNLLKRGSKDKDAVTQLQQRLKEAGYDIEIDGIFGPKTEAALKAFQKEKGLVVDGIYGEKSNNSLLEALGITGEEGKKFEQIEERFRYFTNGVEKFQSIVKGVSAALSIVGKFLGFIWNAAKHLLVIFKPIGNVLLTIGAAIGDALVGFNKWLEESGVFTKWLEKFKEFLEPFSGWLEKASEAFLDFFGLSDKSKKAKGELSGFQKMWKSLLDFFAKPGKLQDALRNTKEMIVAIALSIWEFVKTIFNAIKGIFSSEGGNKKNFADVLKDLFAPFAKVGGWLGSIFSLVFSIFEWVTSGLMSFAKIVGPGGIIAILVGILGAAAVIKLLSSVGKIAKGVSNVVSTVNDKIENFGFTEKKSTTFLKIAAAILIIVKAVHMLGTLDTPQLIQGMIGLTVIMGLLIAFKYAINKVGGKKINVSGIISLSLAIVILSSMVKMLGNMKTESMIQGLLGLAGIMALILGFSLVLNKIGSSNVKIKGLIKLSLALVIMAFVLKIIGGMKPEEFIRGLIGLTAVMILILGFVFILEKIGSSNVNTKGIIKLSVSLVIFALVLRIIGTMETGQLIKGVIGLGIVMGLILGFTFVLNKIGNSNIKMKGVLKLSIALGIFAIVLRMIGSMKTENLVRGVLGLAAVMVLILGFTYVLKKIGSSNVKMKGILKLAIALGIFAIVLSIIGRMKTDQLIRGIFGLAAVMFLILGFTFILDKIGSSNVKMKGILKLAIALGIFALVLNFLGNMETKKLMRGLLGLGAIMIMILAFTFVLNKIGSSNVKVKGLLKITLAIGILALIVNVLGSMSGRSIAKGLLALGAIMVMLGIFIAVMNRVGGYNLKTAGLLGIAVVIAILAGVVATLGGLSTQSAVQGILGLLVVLTALGIFLKTIGKMDFKTGLAAMASCIGVAIFIAAFALALKEIKDVNTDKILPFAIGLTALMLGLGVFMKLAGSVGLQGVIASLVGLLGVIAVISLVIAAFALLSKIPGFQEFMNSGAEAIGSTIGSFIGALKAAELKSFAKGLSSFEGVQVDEEGIKNAIKGAQLVADFADGLPDKSIGQQIVDWITGSKLSTFSSDMVDFASGFNSFATILAGVIIPEDLTAKTEAAVKIATSISDFNAGLPDISVLDSLASWITGQTKMSLLATDMVDFATGFNSFATIMSGMVIPEDLSTKAQAAVDIATIIKTFNDGLPPVDVLDNIVTWITGETKMSLFTSDMVDFATGFNTFATKMSGMVIPEDLTTKTQAAVDIATIIKTFNDGLPPVDVLDNIVTWITGETKMSLFSGDMVDFATGFNTFATKMSGMVIPEDLTTKTQAAVDIATIIKSFNDGLPEVSVLDKVVTWITGETKMSLFTSDMVDFATGFNTFATKMSDMVITEDLSTKAQAAVDIATIIKTFNEGLPEVSVLDKVASWITGETKMSLFSGDMVDFATGFNSFATIMSGMVIPEDLSTKAQAAVDISEIINQFSKGVPDTGAIDKIVTWMTGETSMSLFSGDMVDFATGFNTFATKMSEIVIIEGLDEKTQAAVSIAGYISDLANKLPDINLIDAIATWLTGETAMSLFSSEMTTFVDGFNKFAAAMATITEPTESLDGKSKAASEIAGYIADLGQKLPNSSFVDKIATWLTGETAMSLFSSEMTTFVDGFNKFAAAMNDVKIPEGLSEKTTAAVDIAGAIADLGAGLPRVGLLDKLTTWITGDTAMTLFATDMSVFAEKFNKFATGISGIGTSTIETDTDAAIKTATQISNFIASLSDLNIESNKGIIEKFFTGDTKANTIFDQTSQLGIAVKNASENFKGLSEGTFEADAKAMRSVMGSIISLLAWISSDSVVIKDSVNFSSFTFDNLMIQMAALGESIANFDKSTTGVDQTKFSSIADSMNKILTPLASLATILAGEGDTKLNSDKFLEGLKTDDLKANIDLFTTTIGGSLDSSVTMLTDKTTTFNAAGQLLGSAIGGGISGGDTSSGVDTLVNATLKVFDDRIIDFVVVGANSAAGFGRGLKNSAYLAEAAAKEVAKQAKKAAMDELGEKSPSKEFAKIGRYADMGLANGFREYSKVVSYSAEQVASSAMDSTSKALGGFSEVLAMDLDSDPVIRPVVDLSDVTSGAKAINGMLYPNRSINIDASRSRSLASSISSKAIPKNQNGSLQNGSGIPVGKGIDLHDNNFYIRSENDIHLLAHELASLTRQEQRGQGAPA